MIPLYINGLSGLASSSMDPTTVELPHFSLDELIGTTFLKTLDDGQVVRAEVIKKINDFDAQNHKNIKMLLKYGDGDAEELISYVELNDIISQMVDDEEANPDRPFIYKGIILHQGPLNSKDKNYKGSKYNVKVRFASSSSTICEIMSFNST